jgi:hypothetical protein
VLTDARRLAVASAIAALTASTLLACWAGRDAVAAVSTAQRLARFTVVMALPGLAVAAAAPSLTRWTRLGAVAAGAGLIVGCAVWQRDEGGVLLAPAALLLLAAALPTRSHEIPTADETDTETKPARADLVTAAALVGLAGLVGRAIALDANAGLTTRLGIAATGLVVLAWPLIGAALLPPRLRHRWLLAAGVALVAIVIARAPAGGEPWLVPGAVLLLVAALAEPADDEDPVGQF